VNYIIHIAIMIEIYMMLALSLNLTFGFGGLMSLCNAAFYGIGAYATTLLMIKLHIPFLTATLVSLLFTGLIAYLFSFPALRFRGDTFALVTLGFQIIIFSILYNWTSLTQGPYGIPGIPRPEIFGIKFNTLQKFFLLSSVFLILLFAALYRIYNSPFCLSLKALREDEIAAESLGKSPFKFFSRAFTLSGSLAAIPGTLYATYISYIDPTSFTLDESIFQLAILLVGGSGNIKGPIAGTIFMVILPEILRF